MVTVQVRVEFVEVPFERTHVVQVELEVVELVEVAGFDAVVEFLATVGPVVKVVEFSETDLAKELKWTLGCSPTVAGWGHPDSPNIEE